MSEALKDFDLLFSLIPIQADPNAAQRVLDANDRVRAALEQPSTAEIRARALEDACNDLIILASETDLHQDFEVVCEADEAKSMVAQVAHWLQKKAQRIREGG